MRIKAKEEIAVLMDELCDVCAYIHYGDEFDVLPTDDGVKFEFCNSLLSPLDFVGKFEIIEEKEN